MAIMIQDKILNNFPVRKRLYPFINSKISTPVSIEQEQALKPDCRHHVLYCYRQRELAYAWL